MNQYKSLRYLDDKSLWDLDKHIYTSKGKWEMSIILECCRRDFDHNNLYSMVCERVKREAYENSKKCKKDKEKYLKYIKKLRGQRLKDGEL
jgi:CRISPR/Cas system CMR-associated protein Cmr1 (group 7 of RAMP superfamily)